MRKFILSTALLFVSAFLWQACQDQVAEEVFEPLATEVQTEDAIAIAAAYFNFENYAASGNATLRQKSRQSNHGKEVKMAKAVKGRGGRNALHVINYEGGGWAIVAGDTRFKDDAVFAFNEEGEFNYDEAKELGGINKFLSDRIALVEKVQSNTPNPEDFEIVLPYGVDPPGGGCTPFYTEDKMFPHTWSQWGEYNNTFYGSGCAGGGERNPAGCVPIAIGAVAVWMNSTGDYGSWSDSDKNDPTFANKNMTNLNALLKGIYDEVPSIKKSTACTGTGILVDNLTMNDMWDDASEGNYSTRYTSQVSSAIIKTEIDASRPMTVEGCTTGTCGFLGTNGSGHMWNIGGYKNYRICPSGAEYFYAWYSWGWGTTGVGWYGITVFDPTSGGSGDYDHLNRWNTFRD